MSYQFEAPPCYDDEHLDHQPVFRDRLHGILRDCSNLTYVGWHGGGSFFDFYLPLIEEIHVIEVWRPNLENLRVQFPTLIVHWGDVRHFARFMPPHVCDCVLWQQGPEHMPKREATEVIRQMQLHYAAVILETPNGWRQQDANGNNPYEQHLSAWHEHDFVDLGFDCTTFMGPNRAMALLAVWQKDLHSS